MSTKSETPKIRVMLVDDHIVVRMGLTLGINSQPDMQVVAQAQNGDEAIELSRQHSPDVTVIDLRMPKRNGVETIIELRRKNGGIRILVLSSFAGGDEIAAALEAGACGFVGKDAPLADLIEAIRQVHAGQQVLPHGLGLRLAARVASRLSARELDVLRLIGKGLGNKDIGNQLGLAEASVKTHVTGILSKLGVTDRIQATLTAIRRGLIHVE